VDFNLALVFTPNSFQQKFIETENYQKSFQFGRKELKAEGFGCFSFSFSFSFSLSFSFSFSLSYLYICIDKRKEGEECVC